MTRPGIIGDLLEVADDIYAIRQEIGAIIQEVGIVTRTWAGTEPGEGNASDVVVWFDPMPGVKDYSLKFANMQGGAYLQGDLIVSGISKQSYPSRDEVTCKSSALNVEKFYLIGEELFQVIAYTERYISWDVHVRKMTNQTRYS